MTVATVSIGAAPPSTPAATTPVASPVTGLIPVEAFAEQPFFDMPVLSPDGQRFAARTRTDGKNRIMIFQSDLSGKPKASDLGDLDVVALRWAGNDRVLVTVTTRSKIQGLTYRLTRLASLDLAAGKMQVLDPNSVGLHAGNVLHVDPAGAWLLVASQDDVYSWTSVKRIDLTTGRVSYAQHARENFGRWFTDGDGVIRAAVSYFNSRRRIYYRDAAGEDMREVPVRNLPDSDDSEIDNLRFASAGDHKVMIQTNARTGRFALYGYDLRSGQVGQAIYEHPEVDVTSTIDDPVTGNPIGVRYTDDRDRVAWLTPAMNEVQRRLDRALPNAENLVVNTSHDGNRVLFWSGAAHDPGTYYLYDRTSRELRPLASPYAALDKAPLARVEPVRYTARDGLSIPGYLTLPAGATSAKGLPLVVMPHGGPYARDSWTYDLYVQFLANRGYVVLQPNFRGSTGYGKAFVEKGHGQWGRKMQDDIDDGVAWLAARGTIDPKRVCIFGASYGGYAAMWGAIRNPETYRCAVSLAGVSDLPDMLSYDRTLFSSRYFQEWRKEVRGTEKPDLAAVSPLNHADRLRIPLLIAHGEKDVRVPPTQSRRMVAALSKRKAIVESVFYPEEGHSMAKRESKLDFLKRLEALLAKYNPA